MASRFHTERRVEDVAAAYVAGRRKSRFLSISHAIRAIRTLMPECEATDRALADIVALAAIERSISVSFDVATGAENRKAAASSIEAGSRELQQAVNRDGAAACDGS